MGQTVSGLFTPCSDGTYAVSFSCNGGLQCVVLDGFLGTTCTYDGLSTYECTNGNTCGTERGTSFDISSFLSDHLIISNTQYFDYCEGLTISGTGAASSVNVPITPAQDEALCLASRSSSSSSSSMSSATSSSLSSSSLSLIISTTSSASSLSSSALSSPSPLSASSSLSSSASFSAFGRFTNSSTSVTSTRTSLFDPSTSSGRPTSADAVSSSSGATSSESPSGNGHPTSRDQSSSSLELPSSSSLNGSPVRTSTRHGQGPSQSAGPRTTASAGGYDKYHPWGPGPSIAKPSWATPYGSVTAWPDTTYLQMFGGKKTSLCKCSTISGAYGECGVTTTKTSATPVYYWPGATDCPVNTFDPFKMTNAAWPSTWATSKTKSGSALPIKPSSARGYNGHSSSSIGASYGSAVANPVAAASSSSRGAWESPAAASTTPSSKSGTAYTGPLSNGASRASASYLWVFALMFGLFLQSCSATGVAHSERKVALVDKRVAGTGWQGFGEQMAAHLDAKSAASEGPSDAGTQFFRMVGAAACSASQAVLDTNIDRAPITIDDASEITRRCTQVLYTRDVTVYPLDAPGYGIEFAFILGGSLLCNYIVNDEFKPGKSFAAAQSSAYELCQLPQPCSTHLLDDPNNCGGCGITCTSGTCKNAACTSPVAACAGSTCANSTTPLCGTYGGGNCNCGAESSGAGFCIPGNNICMFSQACESTDECTPGFACIADSCCGPNKVCMDTTVCSGLTVPDTKKRSISEGVTKRHPGNAMFGGTNGLWI